MASRDAAEDSVQHEIRRLRERIADLEKQLQSAAMQLERRDGELRASDSVAQDRLSEALYESVPVGVCVLDTDLRFVRVNARFAETSGWPAAAHIGKTPGELNPDRGPITEKALRRVLETGEPLLDLEVTGFTAAAPGVMRTWVEQYVPLKDSSGNITGIGITSKEITEHRRADDALKQSEERLRTVIENSRDGISMLDLATGKYVFMSPAQVALTGFTAEEINNISTEEALERVHPGDRDVWIEQQRQLAAGQDLPDPIEYRWKVKSGESRWFSDKRKIVRDAQGQAVAVVGICRDITDQKLAERALRESEVKYRSLFESIDEGFCIAEVIFDEENEPVDCRFIEVNPAFERHAGLADAQGKRILELVPALEQHWFDIFGRIARIGKPIRFENGAAQLHRWYDVYAWRYGDPQNRQVAVLFKDITERRRAEDGLRASVQQLQDVIDGFPGIVFIKDLEGHLVTMNLTLQGLLGMTQQELQGKSEYDILPKDRADHYREQDRRVVESGAPCQTEEHIDFADGSRHVFLINRFPLRDAAGNIYAVCGMSTDITESKLTEERLRQAQKLESLAVLAGGVAHDFNNSLVGIVGNASLAEEMLPPDHPIAGIIRNIARTGQQLAHLTRQMLAYSGKGGFVLEPLNLSALVQEMSDLIRSSVPKKVAIDFELQPNLPAVEADPGQIEQILMNLVVNAAEAIGNGDGLITVRTYAQVVNAAYTRLHPETANLQKSDHVVLEVRDTGSGMDESVKSRIFDPFFSTKFTGRGLGLAAVAGIIRGHRGAIAVDSAPGRGSTFSVLLPAVAARPGRPAKPAPSTAAKNSGVLLIVDDEEVVRETAKQALERNSYTVLVADSGTAAIDIFKRHPGRIDLAILDLSMPGMGGHDTLPELLRIRPDVKVVISSGYTETEVMRIFEGQRVSGFIQKPYTAATLARKIRLALG